MEWPIQALARSAGITSRTLRHYDDIGLLRPSRIGHNGYRYYDEHALVRLQRILLLRELGLNLTVIGDVLAGQQDSQEALRTHLALLESQRDRLGRQIQSVRTTVRRLERGEPLMADEAFDGFDHTRYKDEVVERWGRDAYRNADQWWRSLSPDDKAAFQRRQTDIATDFATARTAGHAPDSAEAQAVTHRHYEWVAVGWQGRRPSAEQYAGLGRMYVDDPRFTAHYDTDGGDGTAAFIRDAMRIYADRNLDRS